MSKKRKNVIRSQPIIKNEYKSEPEKLGIERYFSTNTYFIALIIITILGSFLRLYNIDYNSMWLDEASTLTFISGSFTDIWNLIVTAEANPPLYLWLERVMLLVFGSGEISLRILSVIFGIITIPIVYFIGKEFIDENAGVISAFGIAISPYLILYSQEARAYSMMAFTAALVILFYIRSLKYNNRNDWILFGLSGALSIWTHYYIALLLTAFIFYTLLMYKFTYIKELLLSYGIMFILSTPLMVAIPYFMQRTSIGSSSWGMTGLSVILETLIQFTGFNIILTYIILLLFLCGIAVLFFKEKEKSILLLWLLGFTFLASLYISNRMPMVPRYLIFLNIIIILGVAASYKLLYKLTSKNISLFIIIFLITLTSVPFLMNYYTSYSKDDWRGFSKTLSSMTQPGDSIIVVPGYIYQPLDYYYSNKTDNTIEYLATNETELSHARSLQTGSAYYVVTSDIQAANPNGDALKWIENNTRQLYRNNNIVVFKS